MTDGQNALPLDDFFDFYRRLNPEKFSDSVEKYETDLTPELFNPHLATLSADMLQDDFERFVRRTACRLICPNINPGTGPNGGGDGKTDAETFPVSPDIADKWYVGDGNNGEDRWAFAISVKKNWSSKAESDVTGIVGTQRGFTRIYFFSNQLIRSKARKDKEFELKKKYGVEVNIFDGSWCRDAVFEHGCKDIALDELHFSDEYRRKTVEIGPRDRVRKERLDQLEKKILEYGHVEFDTDYIDDLIEAYILSRELERPKGETEGRFSRAIRECELHGTKQQLFNIKYDMAMTCLFWFKDISAAYNVFRELKQFLKDDARETWVEKYTGILTYLDIASKKGLFNAENFESELTFLKDLKADLEIANNRKASLLYLNFYLTVLAIIDKVANGNQDMDGLVGQLRECFIQSESYIEISCDANERILRLLSGLLPDNEKLSILVDDVADTMMRRNKEISAGKILLERAELNLKKNQFKDAIRRLGKCVLALNKNGVETELVLANIYMGAALFKENLLYSAEACLVVAASMLIDQFYSKGTINHNLLPVLKALLRIEIRLGRLVMFLNWNELRNTLAVNAQEKNSDEYINDYTSMDVLWACLLSESDLSDPLFERLPDVLDRQEMLLSAWCLKVELGWKEDSYDFNQIKTSLQTSTSQKPFLFSLNVSKEGDAYLETIVNNCKIKVVYANSIVNQTVAETFLAALESLAFTTEFRNMIFAKKQLRIKIINTSGVESCEMKFLDGAYILYLNEEGISDSKLWKSFARGLSLMYDNGDLSPSGIVELFDENTDSLVSHLSFLLHYRRFMMGILSKSFKYRIEDWLSDQDKVYKRKSAAGSQALSNCSNTDA